MVTVSGLRTGEGFPNFFHDYTIDEPTLAATFSLRVVSGATPASRGFEMEFEDPELLAAPPRVSGAGLQAALERIVEAPLAPGCFNVDPADLLDET